MWILYFGCFASHQSTDVTSIFVFFQLFVPFLSMAVEAFVAFGASSAVFVQQARLHNFIAFINEIFIAIRTLVEVLPLEASWARRPLTAFELPSLIEIALWLDVTYVMTSFAPRKSFLVREQILSFVILLSFGQFLFLLKCFFELFYFLFLLLILFCSPFGFSPLSCSS